MRDYNATREFSFDWAVKIDETIRCTTRRWDTGAVVIHHFHAFAQVVNQFDHLARCVLDFSPILTVITLNRLLESTSTDTLQDHVSSPSSTCIELADVEPMAFSERRPPFQ